MCWVLGCVELGEVPGRGRFFVSAVLPTFVVTAPPDFPGLLFVLAGNYSRRGVDEGRVSPGGGNLIFQGHGP